VRRGAGAAAHGASGAAGAALGSRWREAHSYFSVVRRCAARARPAAPLFGAQREVGSVAPPADARCGRLVASRPPDAHVLSHPFSQNIHGQQAQALAAEAGRAEGQRVAAPEGMAKRSLSLRALRGGAT
jgi:hypothetical protein